MKVEIRYFAAFREATGISSEPVETEASTAAELFAECGVPKPISDLVEIMQTYPKDEWAGRYMDVTGLTERTFRRHRDQAFFFQAIEGPVGIHS